MIKRHQQPLIVYYYYFCLDYCSIVKSQYKFCWYHDLIYRLTRHAVLMLISINYNLNITFLLHSINVNQLDIFYYLTMFRNMQIPTKIKS